MKCRIGCGACCIAPSISQPFYGMPKGKKAGEPCVHLDVEKRCKLFNTELRPSFCAGFRAEPAICGHSFNEAVTIISELERTTSLNR